MTETIEKLARPLEEAEKNLQRELKLLLSNVQAKKDELKRVRASIRALVIGKGERRSRKGNGLTKSEAIEHVQAVLNVSPDLRGEQLQSAVRNRIEKTGKPLTGYAMRFREALKELELS